MSVAADVMMCDVIFLPHIFLTKRQQQLLVASAMAGLCTLYRDNNQSRVEWLETRDLSAFTFILGIMV